MSESEDLGGDSLADLIDDTDGHAVEPTPDLEPSSSIPETAASEGEDIDVSDPALADIMSDDGPDGESAEAPAAPAEPVVAAPVASAASASSEEVESFRAQVCDLVASDDVERIIHLHHALTQKGSAVPALADIAADVTGARLVSPVGNLDFYASRPAGRAQGWVTGLAFGSQRRAKRFAKF